MVSRSYYKSIGLLGVLSIAFITGCASRQVGAGDGHVVPETHEQLNSVLWVQTSPEHEFACRQSFRLATQRLDQAIMDPSWTAALEQAEGYEDLPPAVILDVDETVLDNSPFDARMVVENMEFDQRIWDEWVAQAAALEIPGARDFLEHVSRAGVEVFFVTNRGYTNEEHTVRNLRDRFGPHITPEQVLSKGEQSDWTSDKTSRRAYVAATHRILLLVGDDFNDFAYLDHASLGRRREMSRQYSQHWGSEWILIPNPMYGTWEQAPYGHDRGLQCHEKLQRKFEALRPME